jgi:U3 small nucleolar RNA-associated protein 11
MVSTQTKDGVHLAKRRNTQWSDQALKNMRDQDLRLMSMKHSQEQRRIEKLESSLQLTGAAMPKQHLVFLDSQEEAQTFDPTMHFDTLPELVQHPSARLRRAQLHSSLQPDGQKPLSKKERAALEHLHARAYHELVDRIDRKRKLDKIFTAIETQRNLMVLTLCYFALLFFSLSLISFYREKENERRSN